MLIQILYMDFIYENFDKINNLALIIHDTLVEINAFNNNNNEIIMHICNAIDKDISNIQNSSNDYMIILKYCILKYFNYNHYDIDKINYTHIYGSNISNYNSEICFTISIYFEKCTKFNLHITKQYYIKIGRAHV